jgi:hypothetical protein
MPRWAGPPPVCRFISNSSGRIPTLQRPPSPMTTDAAARSGPDHPAAGTNRLTIDTAAHVTATSQTAAIPPPA